jgi:glucuronate isomerase
MLNPDRLFDPDPSQRALARRLYRSVADLPIISPHGHVEAGMFVDPLARLADPAALFVQGDHYVYRQLHAHGVPLEALGIRRQDGGPVETDPRRVWQTFSDNFPLFRGTPTGLWLTDELETIFGIEQQLSSTTAQVVYDRIAACLEQAEFQPRRLFQRFHIQTLCTTDSAVDPLSSHQALRASGWTADIRPTLRPDSLLELRNPGWSRELEVLSRVAALEVGDYSSYLKALESRCQFFKQMGAVAVDLGLESALTAPLEPFEAQRIFETARRGNVTSQESLSFTAHMVIELARMCLESGLVLQLHIGALRSHDPLLLRQFGPDRGADIPLHLEFTRSLQALLNRFGNEPHFALILFSLDESAYSRELAPLAGYYPALKLGPPWWFHDSPNGMKRYFDQVMETAGMYKTAGFTDDTRAFCSIPARHDVWRRVSCDWLAGLVLQGRIEEDAAVDLSGELAVGLARRAYRLPAGAG